MTPKPPIPRYWWPFWMVILAAGLFVFYVLFTPIWVGIRLIEWFAHRREVASGAISSSDSLDEGLLRGRVSVSRRSR